MENKILKVQKRNKDIVAFDQQKIEKAIFKAVTATDQGDEKLSKKITNRVIELLNKRFKKDEIPQVEQLQDIVEEVLILEGLVETAKSYILYRDQRRKIREISAASDDSIKAVEDYIKEIDWQVKENANMSYSLQGLNQHITSKISKKYWLNKIYPTEVREAAQEEDIHLHDLNVLAAYCMGWDLYDILLKGFSGVTNKIESKPPKHFKAALGQLVNFLYTIQGEAAGAEAVSSFDTLLAPFIRYDNLNYKQTKQAIQGFLFNCMVPTRVGFQSPFINVTLDIKVPSFYKNQPVIIGGEPQEETYGEFQEEIDTFNKAFYEALLEGDAKNRPFTFPIPTISITKDFDWDNPALKLMWEATAKYGINYFSNFINSDMKPEDSRSMCLHGEEDILIREQGIIKKIKIEELFNSYKGEKIDKEWYKNNKNIEGLSLNPKTGKLEWVKVDKFLRIKEKEMISIEAMDGKTMNVSKDHLVAVFTENGIENKKAEKVNEKDFILTLKDDLDNIKTEEKAFAVTKIKKIEKTTLDSEHFFYDIELQKNHYFVHSQGNITHNCCRLRLDNRELHKRGGGLFGSSPLTGSIGIVTINLPRIGYLSKTKKEFYQRLEKLMDISKESLEIKRKVLEELMEKGLYPYSKYYLDGVKKIRGSYFGNHFATIGLVGMNEALLNFLGRNIADSKARKFALEVLSFMREKLTEYQKETDNLYNLEATPAEGTGFRQAKADKEKYPDIITAGSKDVPYYTNSTFLPVDYTDDIFEVLDHQDEFQTSYSGGTVSHLFLGEKLPDGEAAKNLIKKVCENYHLPYVTLTPTFSICPIHGYISGKHFQCPKCTIEQPCEVYSRVVGYLRPVQQWNEGKQQEFKERKHYKA